MKSTHRFALVATIAVLLTASSTFKLPADDTGKDAAPANTAIVPATRPGNWMQRHERINARAKEGDVDLLFIGDSITDAWQNGGERGGKEVWKKYYANRKAMNAGIGGDKTQHVIWRLNNGNIDGIHPKLTVLMIGTNNAPGNDNTAEEIAEGIKTIVSKIREKIPETKILILGIFPRGGTTDEQLEKVVTQNGKKEVEPSEMPEKIKAARDVTMKQRLKNATASALAFELADNKTIFYMDIGPKFLEADGITLPDSIMPDHLHPNAKGYEIWAEAIEPKVAELLGEKK